MESKEAIIQSIMDEVEYFIGTPAAWNNSQDRKKDFRNMLRELSELDGVKESGVQQAISNVQKLHVAASDPLTIIKHLIPYLEYRQMVAKQIHQQNVSSDHPSSEYLKHTNDTIKTILGL